MQSSADRTFVKQLELAKAAFKDFVYVACVVAPLETSCCRAMSLSHVFFTFVPMFFSLHTQTSNGTYAQGCT